MGAVHVVVPALAYKIISTTFILVIAHLQATAYFRCSFPSCMCIRVGLCLDVYLSRSAMYSGEYGPSVLRMWRASKRCVLIGRYVTIWNLSDSLGNLILGDRRALIFAFLLPIRGPYGPLPDAESLLCYLHPTSRYARPSVVGLAPEQQRTVTKAACYASMTRRILPGTHVEFFRSSVRCLLSSLCPRAKPPLYHCEAATPTSPTGTFTPPVCYGTRPRTGD